MKKILFLAVTALFFAGCTIVNPMQGGSSKFNELPTENFKIKNSEPITYEYKAGPEGCSEVEFLKKFVGKAKKKADGSTIRVDYIMNLHMNVAKYGKKILFFNTGDSYFCSFWGMAVEYEKK